MCINFRMIMNFFNVCCIWMLLFYSNVWDFAQIIYYNVEIKSEHYCYYVQQIWCEMQIMRKLYFFYNKTFNEVKILSAMFIYSVFV